MYKRQVLLLEYYHYNPFQVHLLFDGKDSSRRSDCVLCDFDLLVRRVGIADRRAEGDHIQLGILAADDDVQRIMDLLSIDNRILFGLYLQDIVMTK